MYFYSTASLAILIEVLYVYTLRSGLHLQKYMNSGGDNQWVGTENGGNA